MLIIWSSCTTARPGVTEDAVWKASLLSRVIIYIQRDQRLFGCFKFCPVDSVAREVNDHIRGGRRAVDLHRNRSQICMCREANQRLWENVSTFDSPALECACEFVLIRHASVPTFSLCHVFSFFSLTLHSLSTYIARVLQSITLIHWNRSAISATELLNVAPKWKLLHAWVFSGYPCFLPQSKCPVLDWRPSFPPTPPSNTEQDKAAVNRRRMDFQFLKEQ